MNQYFPFKVDLSSYAWKADLKNTPRIDASKLAAKSDLASLKADVDKLYIDKLIPVPVDLSKLSDIVKNDVVKKTVYDKLVAKVNSIDTSRFVLKTKYDTDKSEIENKIPDTSGLVKKTDYNAKITEIEGKIPSISGLATNAALTTVENKISNISSLVKKTDYDTKITEIEKKLTNHNHDKYITTPEFNKFSAEVFDARLAQANLVTKTDIDGKVCSLKFDTISGHWKSFKNDKTCFLFHLKSSFSPQDIQVFVLTFLVMYKNGLIRIIRLVLKFMTSQPG